MTDERRYAAVQAANHEPCTPCPDYVDTVVVHQPKYIPSFNGLRGLACLAVFGVHLQQTTDLSGKAGPIDFGLLLQNGNTGVCLFFMMSGFLLSLSFWFRDPDNASNESQRFQPMRYAFKRIGRIVPAYFLCLTALVLLGKASGTLDIALHYLFLHNFTDKTLYSINDPFWTLAVQAQFYVLFPFVLLLLRPFLPVKVGAFVVIAVACAGCYFAHAALLNWASETKHWPIDTGVLSPTGIAIHVSTLAHLPHFFMGMLAAGVFASLAPRGNASDGGGESDESRDNDSSMPSNVGFEVIFWLAAAGVFLLLAWPNLDAAWRLPSTVPDSAGHVDDSMMVGRYNFPFLPALIAVLSVAGPRTILARWILESAPLRLLGVISYGVYVYHLPCLGVAQKLLGGTDAELRGQWIMLAVVGLAISVTVATLSYVIVERPLIRLTRRRASD